jgi:hypothetical protein
VCDTVENLGVEVGSKGLTDDGEFVSEVSGSTVYRFGENSKSGRQVRRGRKKVLARTLL